MRAKRQEEADERAWKRAEEYRKQAEIKNREAEEKKKAVEEVFRREDQKRIEWSKKLEDEKRMQEAKKHEDVLTKTDSGNEFDWKLYNLVTGSASPKKRRGINIIKHRNNVLDTSIGIETAGGVLTKIIERNTLLPATKSVVFSTARDGQTSVEVHILEGENEEARYNRTVDRFVVAGITPAPKGVPKIEVTFDIDSNGNLRVTAKDLVSGNENAVYVKQ